MHRVDELEHDHQVVIIDRDKGQERENGLLASLEALKLKLDLELEKKWEMMQELREEEVEEQEKGGLMSFLWGQLSFVCFMRDFSVCSIVASNLVFTSFRIVITISLVTKTHENLVRITVHAGFL